MIDLKAYDKRLNNHDWYYQWSDHHGTWARGENDYTEIKRLASTSPEHKLLFEAYSKHAFTGKPWGTEHFTLEQLNAVRASVGLTDCQTPDDSLAF